MQDIAEHEDVQRLIVAELEEDQGAGDATTNALIGADQKASAVILTREDCVVSGVGIAAFAFQYLDPEMQVTIKCRDGEQAREGAAVLCLEGAVRAILTAERTALNFMQRMCGIATLTKRFVDAVESESVDILDTRKTTPGLRRIEKYAVACGGGVNHRFGLFDKIMIKDNHRRFWQEDEGLAAAIEVARAAHPHLSIEVEVETIEELKDALMANPDEILLDNMDVASMRECVQLCKGRCRTEASGGITLANIREVAASGVDAISLGCLTHAIRSVDLTLEMESL